MQYRPVDILDYVLDNNKDADFMLAMSMHKFGYSIGEITDVKFRFKDEKLHILSSAYKLDREVADPDIVFAVMGGQYVSAFISRYEEQYEIHFMMHDCTVQQKAEHEEEIAERVVQYMILKTITKLRLDTPKKVDDFIKL